MNILHRPDNKSGNITKIMEVKIDRIKKDLDVINSFSDSFGCIS